MSIVSCDMDYQRSKVKWRLPVAIVTMTLILSACSQKSGEPAELDIAAESMRTIDLPGYPDFLAADGEDVWVTNRDTLQKLSVDRKTPVVVAYAPGVCGAPVVAFGSVWAMSCTEKALLRIDHLSGKLTARIPCGIIDPAGEFSLAAGMEAVWVLSDSTGIMSRVDANKNKIVSEIKVKANSFCAAFGFDAVWITNTKDGSVQRIDPATNTVTATIAVGPQPRFLVAGQHALWVLNQGDGTVTRVDPQSNSVVATIECHVPGSGGDISSGKGLVWVRAKNGRMLQTINRETNEVERIYGPLNGSGGVRVAGALVWVTAHDINKVWVLR
ncbi:MAG: YncE family protein [Cyclobacteriaceae bacterium]|nr:YncE family protein [Cyclobacteriaceae bacterium]